MKLDSFLGCYRFVSRDVKTVSPDLKQDAVFNGEEPKTGAIVKQKKFALKPMTVDEAIEEMELLGHNFYVFKEIKSNTVQVLYLRKDGDLGLIEPEA